MRNLLNEYMLLILYVIVSSICLDLLVSVIRSETFINFILKGLYV